VLLGPAAAAAPSAAPSWPPAHWQAAEGTDHPLVGRIYDVRARAFVPAQEVFARLAEARHLLVGERHDNPDHHRLQAAVLRAVTAAGRRPAVVFEMIDDDQTAALEAFLAGPPPPVATALGPAVAWEARGWPKWSLYQPVAEVALAAALPLAAGGLGRDSLRRLAAEGWTALPADRRAAWQVDGAFPTAVAVAQQRAVMEGHCGLLPEAAARPMARLQAAKDTAMAATMLAAADKADGAVLVAGNGHARTDVGVPFQLRRLGATGGIVAVAALEVAPGETDPSAYGAPYGAALGEAAPPFDYLVFTPAVDFGDPCADHREALERAGQRLRAGGDETN
jgi:uncharacterized iron-regulated protein